MTPPSIDDDEYPGWPLPGWLNGLLLALLGVILAAVFYGDSLISKLPQNTLFLTDTASVDSRDSIGTVTLRRPPGVGGLGNIPTEGDVQSGVKRLASLCHLQVVDVQPAYETPLRTPELVGAHVKYVRRNGVTPDFDRCANLALTTDSLGRPVLKDTRASK